MDWSNEIYVKLYQRETADDQLLSWEARALWHEMLKRFDRSGIIKARRGAQGLAALVRIPGDVVERALSELLDDGRVQATEGGWVAPNFMAAQEATKSHALRQREYRERQREKAISQSSDTARHSGDTNGHAVTRVTNGVSKNDSYLSLTKLSLSEARAAPLSSEDGERQNVTKQEIESGDRKLRYLRSGLDPTQYEVYLGDEFICVCEKLQDGRYRQMDVDGDSQ